MPLNLTSNKHNYIICVFSHTYTLYKYTNNIIKNNTKNYIIYSSFCIILVTSIYNIDKILLALKKIKF